VVPGFLPYISCNITSTAYNHHTNIHPLLKTNIHIYVPSGATPLCRHIREVTKKIQQWEPTLKETGQKVAVIIATDGLS
tara:strand:- start:225 stop:461 length:237 start_codon:yes stop_codon:yes gene_type:complete